MLNFLKLVLKLFKLFVKLFLLQIEGCENIIFD